MDVRGTFGELVGELDYSMFIVTVRVGDERAGCLVGFGCQSSIDPPRFLICLSRKNHTYRVANGSEALAVHFLPRQAEALAGLFGGHSGDDMGFLLEPVAAHREGSQSHFEVHRAKTITPGHPA